MILPLAELHCHAEATLTPAHARRLAARNGIDAGDLFAGAAYRWHDFTSFLAAYDRAAGLLTRLADYADLARDHALSLHRQGAIYGEIFASPDHAERAGLDPKAYLCALGDGLRAARDACGIEMRIIVTGVRHFGADSVLAAARIAVSTQESLVTGFGMAGDERIGRLSDFDDAFDLARDKGLGLTVHAGEFGGPEAVREAVSRGFGRIGHGVAAARDAALMALLCEMGTVLEVCPTSNIALGLFARLEDHPLPRLLDAGVAVTLSTDDPAFFAVSLSEEHERAEKAFALSGEQRLGLTETALRAAFVDEATRARLLARLDAARQACVR